MGLLVAIKRRIGTDRRCPKCGGTHVRLRSRFARQRWPLRCMSCQMTFGRLRQRACPFCGSGNARTRRDWYRRNNPLRCKVCLSTWGGAQPKAGKKLAEVFAARKTNIRSDREVGEPCGDCACCDADERIRKANSTEQTCGRCDCCWARGYDRMRGYQEKMEALERSRRRR